ncbi:LOW QUALITY PROTEIN: axonemal 84 kDa protein-like [Pecten maximus]|uniref:LOW QUALITY PROTEIN: axonemal 84 kDa protein-like n=1 Tax=Pecten maximus TaxID=6579 RepID=UPI001458A9C8|nr:LOW QUALITY PROTEIN: axonemal 84 kDa protein-like [Pecten maximus]
MPPKKAAPKLSKAEKEKLQQEEDERKAQEDEEAREKAAVEEKERKAKEKQVAAEKKKLENEEKKNRSIEMRELTQIVERNRDALNELHNNRRKKAKWARYMRCDGSPDPIIAGEINTYINLRMEDREHDDVESVLQASKLDISLINELDFLLEDTPPEELSADEVARYMETKEDLQTLMKTKLDFATMKLLQEASVRADPETLNLQYAIKNEDTCLSVWGNLSKNPRIKSFEFAKQGFTFDIPRLLTLSDCGIRVLDPKYDHYSPTCKSFHPRPKKQPEPEVVPEEEVPAVEEACSCEEEKKEVGEEEAPVEREETDLMAALKELEDGPKDENEEEKKEEEEEKEEEVEEFEERATPEPQEWEDFAEDDDIVDLRANDIVGGVLHFDLMHLPPQPKSMASWTTTLLVDPPEIQYMDYVADIALAPPSATENDTPTQEKKEKEQAQETKRDEKPPIGVTMKLPSEVLFSEEPLIARWDYTKKHWKQDGFSDMKYDEDKREFFFKTAYFGTFALMQDSHLNMPFQSWEIRPHGTNSAVLTIIAAIVEIEIEIKDSVCCLSKPEDRPELDKIRNVWVTPMELVKMLKHAGINVFPAVDSSKYVSIQNKHPIVAESAYEQIALTASSFAYSWSKWNGEIQERDKIFFQVSECLQDEPLLEEDWGVFLMTKRRSMKLNLSDFDETYNEEMADGTVFKSNLYHLVEDLATPAAKERIVNTSFQFVDCVTQILKSTKLLTFA